MEIQQFHHISGNQLPTVPLWIASFELAPAYGFDPLSAFRGSTLGENPLQNHLAEMKIRNRTISMETIGNSFYQIHFSSVCARPAAQMFYIIRSAT